MAMRKPGPYVALSATYADDEKIMEAGEFAELLYVRMLAYCARTPLSEGWISDPVMESRLGVLPVAAGNGAGTLAGTDVGSRAGKLQASGLITRDGNGWRIVSWLKWNRSVEEMGRERARDRDRKTSGNDGTDAGKRAGNGAGVPLPIRADRSDQKKLHARAPASAREDRFTEFWMAYPKKVAKGAAERAWAKAVKTTDPDVILAGLQAQAPRLRSVDPQFVKHPSTWLNSTSWEDEHPMNGTAGAGTVRDAFVGIPRPNELRFHDEDDT